jgi:hypothetical protein
MSEAGESNWLGSLIQKTAGIRRVLRDAARLRMVFGLLVTVGSPLALAFLAQWSQDDQARIPYALGATCVIVVVTIMVGGMLALTEKDVSFFVDDLKKTTDRNDELQAELNSKRAQLDSLKSDLQTQIERVQAREKYWETVYAVQEPIKAVSDWWAFWLRSEAEGEDSPPGEDDLSDIFHSLLDPIIEERFALFGFDGDEEWSISIYVWDEEIARLRCLAFRGPGTRDNGEPHRTWPLGVGHVGVACQVDWSVYIEDAWADHWADLFEDRRPEATEDDLERDKTLYRSYAVITFDSDLLEGSDGAVCSTSNRKGRFTQENSAPLRDLAYAIGKILRARREKGQVASEAEGALEAMNATGNIGEPYEENGNEGTGGSDAKNGEDR